MSRVIVLDRDGVINEDSDAFVKSAQEWLPIAGSLEAIARLNHAGWKVAVATNQSGIKRGYYDRATLSSMHLKLKTMLEAYGGRVDWINFSPYLSDCGSVCRKPLTGMLRAIEGALDVDLQGQPMVGDTLADIKVAQAYGMNAHLVKTGKGKRTLAAEPSIIKQVKVYDNLAVMVDELLRIS